MRTPYAKLLHGGADLAEVWGPLLTDLTITDERADGDNLSVTLDDAGGRILYPETGATVTAEIGYRDTGGAVVGTFIVDRVELSGWPQRITIQASSVDAKSTAKARRTETHREAETPTLGDLFAKIAGRNGWTPAVADAVGSIAVQEAEHQAEESDLAFAARLAARHDAIAAVKQGRLVVTPRAGGQTSGGAAIPATLVEAGGNLLTYGVDWADKPVFGKVEARYFDRLKAESVKLEVAVGSASAGGDEVIRRLPDAFPTEGEAQRAAQAEARRLTRAGGTARFEVEGDPTIGAELPITVRGVRAGVDGSWTPTRVEHVVGASGYTTRIECETPGTGDSRGADAAGA